MRISTALIAVCALGLIHGAVSNEARADDPKAPTAESTVMTDKARQLAQDPKPIPDAGPKKAIVVSGAALGLGALGAGIGLLVASGSKGADADAVLQQMKAAKVVCTQPPVAGPCQEIVTLRQSHDTLHNVGVPLLAGGVAVAVVTLTYALWPRGGADPKTTGIRMIPVVGAEGGGLWVGGAF